MATAVDVRWQLVRARRNWSLFASLLHSCFVAVVRWFIGMGVRTLIIVLLSGLVVLFGSVRQVPWFATWPGCLVHRIFGTLVGEGGHTGVGRCSLALRRWHPGSSSAFRAKSAQASDLGREGAAHSVVCHACGCFW